jgi:hypothetical protein
LSGDVLPGAVTVATCADAGVALSESAAALTNAVVVRNRYVISSPPNLGDRHFWRRPHQLFEPSCGHLRSFRPSRL